jgi:hypothetical protein
MDNPCECFRTEAGGAPHTWLVVVIVFLQQTIAQVMEKVCGKRLNT